MRKKNGKVDAYIEKSQEFAKPILTHLRDLIHKACPDVEEKMKWSFPHFDYKGMIMCSMASFKNHCIFGFWKASIMKDRHNILSNESKTAMGQLGRITALTDLPDDKILIEYIKEAMRLNDEGITVSSRPKKEKRKLNVPAYFLEAIRTNKKALQTYENFSYSHRKEYVIG
jgi:hypothetical protein